MRNGRGFLLILISAAGALLLVFLFMGSFNKTEVVPVVMQPEIKVTEYVLTATNEVREGEKVHSGLFQWSVASPADAADPSLLIRSRRPNAINEFSGMVTVATVRPGTQIRSGMFIAQLGSAMSNKLEASMRAYTLQRISVPSHIQSGDRVDLIAVYDPTQGLNTNSSRPPSQRSSGTMLGRNKAETIMTNVLVLGVGGRNGGQGDAPGNELTIQVLPKHVETLALLAQGTTIYISQLSASDSQNKNIQTQYPSSIGKNTTIYTSAE